MSGSKDMNVDDYRVDVGRLGQADPRPKTDARRQVRYLSRNVPMEWLARAAHGGGASLSVAITIAHEAGISRADTVKPRQVVLRQFGVSRAAESRALERLEALGLIVVDRLRGRRPRVTVIWAAEEI